MIRSSSKWVTHTLLLSIIPVIVFGTIIYFMGSRIVQEEIHRASTESLSQVRYQIESKVKFIEQMTNQIKLQSDVIAVMNVQDEPQLGAFPRSNEVRNLLSQMKNATDTVHSIYFYHLKQRIVIADDMITSIDEDRVFRDLSWLNTLDELIADRRRQTWVTPREMMSRSGQPMSTLTLVSVLPMLYNQAKAAIVVNLNPDFLTNAITSFPLGSDGKMLVINEEGRLIAQTSGDEEALGELDAILQKAESIQSAGSTHTMRMGRQFVSILKSDSIGWKYVLIVPANVPRQQVEDFKRLIIAITIVLMMFVLYSAYFTHSRFQTSIRSILERLSPAGSANDRMPQGDTVAQIENHINQLLREVKEGRSRQEMHMPLLRAHYLHAAILNNAVDISRITQQIEKEEMFPYRNFSVMAAQMDDTARGAFDKEQALFLFAVSNIGTEMPKLQPSAPYRIESMITDRHAVLIVNYNADQMSKSAVVALADQLRSLVKQILKHTITIGVGSSVDAAHHLSHSYREALQALNTNLANAYDEVLPYHNMTLVADKLVQYPAAEEQDLLNALRSRDGEEARRSLAAFRDKLEYRSSSFHMTKTLYLQLVVALIRLVQEYEENLGQVFKGGNPYEEFLRLESVSHIHEWLEERILRPIVHYMESVKRRKTEVMIKHTLEMIRERYSSDLSLQAVAGEMGISASYLSKLFKEELGETFIDYVTRVRLEHVRRLLVETDLTMQQISEAIGYTSVQQMFRVFKKRLGMTPGEYREQSKS